ALGVAAGRLEVAVRPRADPDVLPGRRQGELADPGQHRRVAHRPAAPIEVTETATAAQPANAPGRIADEAQASPDGAKGTDGAGGGHEPLSKVWATRQPSAKDVPPRRP